MTETQDSKTEQQTIPTVDLNAFVVGSEEERIQFVKTVGTALADIGFFAVKNHGINQDLIQRSYGVVKDFFLLDDEKKEKYEDLEIKGQRGFTRFGREHAKDHAAPDLKEYWHVGREFSKDNQDYSKYPANVWPDEVPTFKPSMLQLYRQLEDCAMHLLDACSLYLGRPESFLRDCAEGGNSILRAIHYPPVAEGADPASIRAAAHEDINFITLLCESTADGLELLQRDGKWLPIKSLEGQIIVDAGDMLQNMTNGLLKSTTHRVTNPDSDRVRRFSMPFFVHPRPEVTLNPIDECIQKTGATKYPNMTAGQYLTQRLEEIGLG